ncbi:winged helix-turn-helix transcriptional regulator [Schaalia suimastitidis]|uniref:winged helix-turn-helix transcriptional regulator n=1 Tax=Schaalia suimastitidis TaxID=121163 RepID=UPI0004134001|nr:helix-turn-helix domain-containing protein [Schaalia suimastitidis]
MPTRILEVTQWDPYNRDCPTRRLLDRIGDRWTVLVIGSLEEGPRRFGELKKAVDGISQKMLTQTLRGLEEDGLVTRTVTPQIPPRVDYELTELGRTLIEPLAGLESWARTHMQEVLQAREAAARTPNSN